MKKQLNDIIQFHELLTEQLAKLEETADFPKYFYQAFLSGENTLYQKDLKESKKFDKAWLDTIESFFPSLEKITLNAKTGLRYERHITNIEQAKKVGPESVRHLASNTRYIKEIKHGNVIPNKLLTTHAEIELGTYENRFVATLIDRLIAFLKERIEIVSKDVNTTHKRHFNLESSFLPDNLDVKISVNLLTKEEIIDDQGSIQNNKIIERMKYILTVTHGLKQSEFMKELKNTKSVRSPIMKTQIILKNVDYHNAYLLWLFLDKHHTISYELDVEEKNLTFDQKYLKSVYQTALVIFSNITANQQSLEFLYKYLDQKSYKKETPKILKTHPNLTFQLDPVMVEDTRINEYYLEQNKKLFKENLDQEMAKTPNYEIALKRALKDTINISNALYNSYFELDTELNKDIFTHLVKENTEKRLEDTKKKAKIARIIRETKEIDYKAAIRLEKRLLKETESLNRQHVLESKKRLPSEVQKVKLEEKVKLDNDKHKKRQLMLTEYQNYVKSQSKQLKETQKKTLDLIEEEKKRLEMLEKEHIAIAKQQAKDEIELKVQELKSQIKSDKEKLNANLKQVKLDEQEKFKQEKAEFKKTSQQKLKEAIALIQKEKTEKEQSLKETRLAHESFILEQEALIETTKQMSDLSIQEEKQRLEHIRLEQVAQAKAQLKQTLALEQQKIEAVIEKERKIIKEKLKKARAFEAERLKKEKEALKKQSQLALKKEKEKFESSQQSQKEHLKQTLDQRLSKLKESLDPNKPTKKPKRNRQSQDIIKSMRLHKLKRSYLRRKDQVYPNDQHLLKKKPQRYL